MGSVVNRYYALLLKRKGFQPIERLDGRTIRFLPQSLLSHERAYKPSAAALKAFLTATDRGDEETEKRQRALR